MTARRQAAPPVYELVVVGPIGPALRRALEPFATACSEVQTILRAEAPHGRDLVDLMVALESRGLDVADIAALA